MKRFLLIFATALFIASCGQKDNNEQEQPKDKEVYIPQGVPVAPMQEIQIQEKGEALGDPNGPVLKLEEGKPLDFNQLQGGGMSVGDQVAAQIDSIRYKAEHGDAKYQYAYGVCYEKGWGVEKDLKQALTWYNKAAAQNNGPAYNSLGNFYREGSGVKPTQRRLLNIIKMVPPKKMHRPC